MATYFTQASENIFEQAKDRLNTEIAVSKALANGAKNAGFVTKGNDYVSIQEVQRQLYKGNTKIFSDVMVDYRHLIGLKHESKALQDLSFTNNNYPGGIDPMAIIVDSYVGFDTVKNGLGRIIPMLLSQYNYERITGNILPNKPTTSSSTPFPSVNPNTLTITQKLIAGRIMQFELPIPMEKFLATYFEVIGRTGSQGNLSLLGQSIAPEFLSMLLKLFSQSVNASFEFQTYAGAVAYSLGGGVTPAGAATPSMFNLPANYYPNGGDVAGGATGGVASTYLWGSDGIPLQLLANAQAVSTDTKRYDPAGKINIITTPVLTSANIVSQLYAVFLQIPLNLLMLKNKKDEYVMKLIVSLRTYQLIQQVVGTAGIPFGAANFFYEIQRMFSSKLIVPLAGMIDNSLLFIRADNDIETNMLLGVSMPFWQDGSSIQVIYPDEATGVSQVIIKLRVAYTPSIPFPKNCAFGTNMTLPSSVYTTPVFSDPTSTIFPYGQ